MKLSPRERRVLAISSCGKCQRVRIYTQDPSPVPYGYTPLPNLHRTSRPPISAQPPPTPPLLPRVALPTREEVACGRLEAHSVKV